MSALFRPPSPHAGTFLEAPVSAFEATSRVNYLGVVHTLKAVLPGMVERCVHKPRIIFYILNPFAWPAHGTYSITGWQCMKHCVTRDTLHRSPAALVGWQLSVTHCRKINATLTRASKSVVAEHVLVCTHNTTPLSVDLRVDSKALEHDAHYVLSWILDGLPAAGALGVQ